MLKKEKNLIYKPIELSRPTTSLEIIGGPTLLGELGMKCPGWHFNRLFHHGRLSARGASSWRWTGGGATQKPKLPKVCWMPSDVIWQFFFSLFHSWSLWSVFRASETKASNETCSSRDTRWSFIWSFRKLKTTPNPVTVSKIHYVFVSAFIS